MTLTDQDIQRLTEVLASKKDVEDIREDVSSLREPVHQVMTANDGMAGAVKDVESEQAAIISQLDRHEDSIKKLETKPA